MDTIIFSQVDVVRTNNDITFTMPELPVNVSQITLTAKFKDPPVAPPVMHIVTFNIVNGSKDNGTLEAAVVNGAKIVSGATVEQGKDVVFTARPNVDYKIKAWKLNGTVVTNHTDLTYTLKNVMAAAAVTVEFEQKPYYLTIRAEIGGWISLGETGYYDGGEYVRINAEPYGYYYFDAWEATYGTILNAWRANTTFVMPDRDVTLTARFIPYDYYGYPYYPYDPNYPYYPYYPYAPSTPSALQPQPAPVATPDQGNAFNPGIDPMQTVPYTGASVTPVTGSQSSGYQTFAIENNGGRVNTGGAAPILKDGVPYIPVRPVFEQMGFTCAWNQNACAATLTRRQLTIVLTEGEWQFTVNGRNCVLKAPVEMVDGNLMTPFAELLDSIDCTAYLDESGTLRIFFTD
jgi:hypothetical protein